MSAWDASTFGNDDAADWAGDLTEGGSVKLVRKTLERAAKRKPKKYLESPEGAEALAAAEVVAAAANRPVAATAYSESALRWAAENPSAGDERMVTLASTAVRRVMGENSELRELWAEAGDESLQEWLDAVHDLRSRLSPEH